MPLSHSTPSPRLPQHALHTTQQFAATLTAVALLLGLCLSLATVLAVGPLAAPAVALHNPVLEQHQSVWKNVNARSTDPQQQVDVQITDVQPRVVNTNPHSTDSHVTYHLHITNHRNHPVNNVSMRLRSLPAVATPAQVRRAALSNSGEYTESTAAVQLPSLGPHESRDVEVVVALDPEKTAGVGVFFPASHLRSAGPHPIMFALSGDTLQGQTGIIGVARTTLTVSETPAPPSRQNEEQNQEDQQQNHPTPLTFLWPLAADTDITPGGIGDAPERAPLVLHSEKLAQELGEHGRLRGLLDAYRAATERDQQLRSASCIALDPELVDTVQRMAEGYHVGEQLTLQNAQPRRLRDSWGKIFGTSDEKSVVGTGAGVARRWLDDLRDTVSNGCTVALPFAGADVNTLVNAGNQELINKALQPKRNIIREVLGVEPLQNVTVPTSGYITENAAAAFSGQTALVADNTVTVTEQAQLTEAIANDPALAPHAQAVADRTVFLPEHNVTALRYSGNLATVLRATGRHPQVAGFSNPDSRFDVRQDSDVARMGDALGVLDREVAAGDPVLAVPPVNWSVSKSDAAALLNTFSSFFRSHRAQPASLHDSLISRGIDKPAIGHTFQPFVDPGAPTLDFARQLGEAASEVQKLRGLMVTDERLALTPEAYTRPLLQDLLRASAGQRVNSIEDWGAERKTMRYRMNTVRHTVQGLRSTITLVPPGTVFTRSSDSSPLFVVARNGLPLPVPISVGYDTTPRDFGLDVPEKQIIPAEGSITLSLNTKNDTTPQPQPELVDLKMWLNSVDGERISGVVELAVQRAPGMGPKGLLIVLAFLLALALTAKTLWRRRVGGKRSSVRHTP